VASILSITTADRTSLSNGNLLNFLDGAESAGISVVLVLRDCDTYQFERLNRYSCIIQLLFSDNGPATTIRNFAISSVVRDFLNTFDFIAFLDDDCIPTSGLHRLELISPNSDLAIGSYGPSLSTLAPRFSFDKTTNANFEYLLNRSTNCTMYFRPTLLGKLGPFYERIGAGINVFKTGEDTDMCNRYIKMGARFEIDNSIFVVHPYKLLPRAESISGDLLVSLSHFTFTRRSLYKTIRTTMRFLLLKYSIINSRFLPRFSTLFSEVLKMRKFLKSQTSLS